MKLLSFESSAVSAGVCLTDGDKVIASSFQNCGLTHSRTLLPMAQAILESCGIAPGDIDGFAVAAGPGSFTGIRIGVATVKGLAMAHGKPCAAVSTLEAMAYGLGYMQGDVCCVMDARAGQVYNARFALQNGVPVRVCEDRAIKLEDLAAEIGGSAQILVGDGAYLCYTKLNEVCAGLRLAPAHLIYPSGYGVAMAARKLFEAGLAVSPEALRETYLRKPQAEREREEKQKERLKSKEL